MTTLSTSKADWLRTAAAELKPYFVACGVAFPGRVRFIPHPRTDASGHLGHCYQRRGRIWVSDRCADTAQTLTVLAHELLHLAARADPEPGGHGKEFMRVAGQIDLRRAGGVYLKAGPKLAAEVRRIEAALPPLPVQWVAPRRALSVQEPWR